MRNVTVVGLPPWCCPGAGLEDLCEEGVAGRVHNLGDAETQIISVLLQEACGYEGT